MAKGKNKKRGKPSVPDTNKEVIEDASDRSQEPFFDPDMDVNDDGSVERASYPDTKPQPRSDAAESSFEKYTGIIFDKLKIIFPIPLLISLVIDLIYNCFFYGKIEGRELFDTTSYFDAIASIKAGKPDLIRTPIYPIFLKICQKISPDHMNQLVGIIHIIIFFVSIILFYKLMEQFTDNKVMLVLGTILYGCMTPIIQFNLWMMTESMSVSGTVLFAYFAILYVKKGRFRDLTISICISLLMTMLRPSCAYLFVVCAIMMIPLIVSLIKRKIKAERNVLIPPVIFAVCIAVLLSYMGMNKVCNDCFSLSYVSEINKFYDVVQADIWHDLDDSEVKTSLTINFDNGAAPFNAAIDTELEFRDSAERRDMIRKFNRDSISSHPDGYINYLMRKVLKMGHSHMMPELTNDSAEGPLWIGDLMDLNINFLYFVFLLSAVGILTIAIRKKRLAIPELIITLIIGGQLAVNILSGPDEYHRLNVSIISMGILLVVVWVSHSFENKQVLSFPDILNVGRYAYTKTGSGIEVPVKEICSDTPSKENDACIDKAENNSVPKRSSGFWASTPYDALSYQGKPQISRILSDSFSIRLLAASAVLMLVSLITTILMYEEIIPNNFIVYFSYPLSMILLILAVRNKKLTTRSSLASNKATLIILLAVSVVYFVAHYYNYPNAPWSNYGLFDDGAWDIFDARLKCFTSSNLEMIFWDENIGLISRELVFHYYISLLFRIFGYNLAVFNAGLVILGWITVLFTMLSVKEISNNKFMTAASGILLTFLPLEFTQVNMGHRYAVCGPLLMISFYFLIRAFKRCSVINAVISGLFAGFTMSSAIMGKQYIWGLIASLVIYLVICFFKRKDYIVRGLTVASCVLIGFITSSSPLWAYILTHKDTYNIRESNLIKDFFQSFSETGFDVVRDNLKILFEVLFASDSGYRQFSIAYPALPWFIAIFFFGGLILMIKRRRFLTAILSVLPMAGCIVSYAYDFRILIAAPFIIMIVVETVFFIVKRAFELIKNKNDTVQAIVSSVIITAMMMPGFNYIFDLANDPNSQYLLPHDSVAVSRYIQDLAIGDDTPSIEMKNNEFNLPNTNDRYDLFACVRYSYAHVHAFLGSDYSRYILKLCGDFPYASQSDEEIRSHVRDTIAEYEPSGKDLMLAFEMSDQVEDIVKELKDTGLTEESTDEFNIDGNDLTITRLYIHSEDIERFRELAAGI